MAKKKSGKNVEAAQVAEAPAVEEKGKATKADGIFLNGVSDKNVQSKSKEKENGKVSDMYIVTLWMPKDPVIRSKYGIAENKTGNISATFAVSQGCGIPKPQTDKDGNPVKDADGNQVVKWNIRLGDKANADKQNISLIVRDPDRKTEVNGQTVYPSQKVSANEIIDIFKSNRDEGKSAAKTRTRDGIGGDGVGGAAAATPDDDLEVG